MFTFQVAMSLICLLEASKNIEIEKTSSGVKRKIIEPLINEFAQNEYIVMNIDQNSPSNIGVKDFPDDTHSFCYSQSPHIEIPIQDQSYYYSISDPKSLTEVDCSENSYIDVHEYHNTHIIAQSEFCDQLQLNFATEFDSKKISQTTSQQNYINTENNLMNLKTDFVDYSCAQPHFVDENIFSAVNISISEASNTLVLRESTPLSNEENNESADEKIVNSDDDDDDRDSRLEDQFDGKILKKRIPCTRTLTRKIMKDIRISLIEQNFTFIKEIGSIFILPKVGSIKNELSIFCSNLMTFLSEQIEYSRYVLNNDHVCDTRTQHRQVKIKNVTKLKFFCPFCPIKKFKQKNYERMEKKLMSDFPYVSARYEFLMKFKGLFESISKVFEEPFNLQNLFGSGFFSLQRMLFEDLLNFIKFNKIIFSEANRQKYLHIEYHKLFFTKTDMKCYFLPEFQSIIYVLLRASLRNHIIVQIQYFMILFYSLYSMNKLFDWIHEFYQKNKTTDGQRTEPLSRFLAQSLSFLLRISFIEPIWSLVDIPKSAQVQYHILCLNIYHDELCIFLQEKREDCILVANSKIILPIAILIDKYNKNEFVNILKFDMIELVRFNRINIFNFIDFLKLMKNANVEILNDQSVELLKFLHFHFLIKIKKIQRKFHE